MTTAVISSNVGFAQACTSVLPKVATVSGLISVVAFSIFNFHAAALGATLAPVCLMAASVAGAIALVSLIGFVAAKVFIRLQPPVVEPAKRVDVQDIIKQQYEDLGCENDGLCDPTSDEPLDESALFVVADFGTYNGNTIETFKKVPTVRLGNGMVCDFNSANIYFPNLAIRNKYTQCPITKLPFEEPYICQEDGHTYEKQAFIDHWHTNHTSPVTGALISQPHLFPNRVLFPEGADIGKPLTL